MNDLVRVTVAMVKRDMRLFWSYRLRLALELVGTIFAVALFYELSRLVSGRRFANPVAYFDFAAVGLAFTPMLRTGVIAPAAALRDELLAGTLERLALSPLGAARCLLATLVFPFAVALVTGLVILLVTSAFFGMHVTWPATALAVPLGVLSALALAPFAALLLAATVLVKQVGAGSGYLLAPLSLLGGVYFPVALLPPWIRWGSDVQPITPSLALLRHVLIGTPAGAPFALELAKLVAFIVVGLPLGAGALQWACAEVRRRGTLLEY